MKTIQTRTTALLFVTFLFMGIAMPSNAQDIKPFQAQEVKPYQPKETTPTTPKKATSAAVPKDATSGIPSAASLDYFFGLYQYWVPGTSYTVADYANQKLVLHNSSGTGVLPGGIRINKDGTFVWNSSWDGKVIKGKWSTTGDSGYPIELLHAQEGKSWKIGKSTDKGVSIIIWDGSTWYYGKKIK